MTTKPKDTSEASPRPSASSSRRVFLGFWTLKSNKAELRRIAKMNKMSVSSFVDWIVEQFLEGAHITRGRPKRMYR